ncbi:hypothetical protein Patl1_36970 [Pistacia atlantica]|nr:hypothetical protein Patl1_36970 [Pistacia atlantica]
MGQKSGRRFKLYFWSQNCCFVLLGCSSWCSRF